MFPLIPTLALAFLSFISSFFVLLRIIIPILPPHPLSRRVPPSEFGLPNFRTLSCAEKSHIWLASLDLLALAFFVWQVVNEYIGGPKDFNVAVDPASTVRLWLATTLRQTCLLFVSSLTLLHVRMGRSVSFGRKHWMIWAPTLVFVSIGIGLAAVLSSVGVASLWIGLVAYSTTVAVLTSVSFCCLVGTLIIIKRNLAALNDRIDPWPPVQSTDEKPRPSFATEEIDALRDGASWITSNASSRHNSISAWSFTTHHTTLPSQHGHGSSRPATPSHPSVPPRSSFWFNPATPHDAQDPTIPPVPPLPSPYRSASPFPVLNDDPDPFRRDVPSQRIPRVRNGSQTSWLTSESGSQATLSQWSYPTTHQETARHDASTTDLRADLLPSTMRTVTPMANAQVLGGYGYAPGTTEAEKGLPASSAPLTNEIDVSLYRTLSWLIMIWVPFGLALPYFFVVSPDTPISSSIIPILTVLSITLSSPLLALNILFRSPIPIPSGLFDVQGDVPSSVVRGPSTTTLPSYKFSHEYKRSGSVTVVEGRRSGDVWVAKGDAVEGRSKMSRAVGMLSPMPKLAVLPVQDDEMQDGEVTPPLPMQLEESPSPVALAASPPSETSAELGRIRKESKASSYLSGGDESMRFASQIMIAQRHYSAMASTVVLPASPERQSTDAGVMLSIATGAAHPKRHSTHLRARSVTSFSGPQTPADSTISPPPSFPLPPTPPSVRAARLAQLGHKKSFSSGFSFGTVDDMNEIDALTAGVLPLLVPGLKVGDDMRVREGRNWDFSPPVTINKKTKNRHAKMSSEEFGALTDFSSPEVHSTPARRKVVPRPRKTSTHKKNHYSLPSLALGKDGVHTWEKELQSALEAKVVPASHEPGRRNTVWGGETVPNTIAHLNVVHEEDEVAPVVSGTGAKLGRSMSTRTLGLRPDVPHSINTARSSVATLNMAPPSAASTATLFDFEAGINCGPLAQSTPHNSVSQKPTAQKDVAHIPLPTLNKAGSRSSIIYIKSDDENATHPTTTNTDTATSSSARFAQWSSRAVRPLIPSASKLQRKLSNSIASPTSTAKTGSPGGGLRPLSLLQARDTNTNVYDAGSARATTRPLTIGKKQKTRTTVVHDENANILPSSANKKLKPLELARSDTSKMRGILRNEEVLPDVVVRPPSTSEHVGFAYSFRD